MVNGKSIVASVLLIFGICTASIADNPIPVLDGIEVEFELVNRDGYTRVGVAMLVSL